MRYELKFRLNASQYFVLREKMRMLVRPDKFAGPTGSYKVWSLYYDTTDLAMFYEKVNGDYEHMKLRLRSYDGRFDPETGAVFAECKIKYQDNQAKWRQKLSTLCMHQELWHNYSEHYPLVRHLVNAHSLFPTCYVRYLREPMEGMVGNQMVRLNFDTDISAARPGQLSAKPASARGAYRKLPVEFDALLEVKVADPDLSIQLAKTIQSVGARQTTFSKYGASLEYIGEERMALGILV